MSDDQPWVVLFPYLPVREPLVLDERWEVRLLKSFDGPWAVDWFETVVRDIAARHHISDGTPVPDPAVLVDRERGVTGEKPVADERAAVEVALGFGIVDANRFRRSDAELELIAASEDPGATARRGRDLDELREENDELQWDTSMVGTSDNAEPFIWRLNREARIAMEYGAIVRTTVGGAAVRVMAPTELHLPRFLTLDQGRVSSLYQVLAPTGEDQGCRQLRESLRWMLQAWRNTPSLRVEHRVVLLRTAFEVLLSNPGEKHVSKEVLARRLSDRFRTQLKEVDVRPGQMLWQGKLDRRIDSIEEANYRYAPFDDLERWFIGFSRARNDIVHDGVVPALSDSTAGSVFAGEYWSVATRVLRDLTLAELHARGHERLWEDGFAPIPAEIIRSNPSV